MRRIPRIATTLMCILALLIHVTDAVPGKDCAKTQCTNKANWGGFIKNSNGATSCRCSDGPTCDCFQGAPKFFLCLSYAGEVLVGNPADAENCPVGQVDCRNCNATTPTAAPVATTSAPSVTATPGENPSPASPSSSTSYSTIFSNVILHADGGNGGSGSNSSNSGGGGSIATTINPASIPIDTTLVPWQIGLAIASGVLMLVVVVCVLASWRKACSASQAADKHANDDARFYRDNYRSQTFQQSQPPQSVASHRRSSLAQSMLDHAPSNQQPPRAPPPVASF
ncbi:hypothetical protein, variant 1 [Aphanomyces astaci]|uniref:EGF-like domain-containing protein n=1 Tax=Aphanomyces astaci TaxID=112090 RepID=W4FQV6_APHAT|nr:hypothetical protein, variant 1 [Aphanomyces astaci]ETV69336.1 hypothetical protein, variant 1 [Aphanomyces astaci]|eukprot:XP_009841193.1 hypothetical protein, variant 1 [Aphanomyces astaci]